MADEQNKDVVGARINLDTSKILPAFRVIDEGAKQNAESFKGLNAELTTTAKSYETMAKAADKLALTADQRRAKILEESKALVASRTAQAEFYKAKTQQLDLTNQVVDSKLKAQQAIQKKRQDAIQQQEKEHQQRMATLTQKTAAASADENLVQTKIDRQFQLMKAGDARLEMEAERHAAQMKRMSQSGSTSSMVDFTGGSTVDSIGDKIQNAAMHAVVFHGVYTAINETAKALKEGLVDIESNMAGYVQTNEKYFLDYNIGTHEMTMNTQKLHEETVGFIHTAHDLGSEITDVTESARLWGRMYKDVGIVQEMVRASTKLSTIDLVGLEDATKGMESVFAQYGVQIRNTNEALVMSSRVVDSWSKVAHDTMAPAADLAAAFERTGKIADETGVSFDFMNGLISAGVRNTALGGANLGNMWKTVLGTIRTDKAVSEIEKLGVATKEVVNGTEQWRKAEDILLDLSIKVTDKNYDLTQSYADISRGIYQYAKLAASLNAGDILLGTAASIGSTGSTMEYLKVQMDTIQRKAAQTKASLLEVFNQAGDDGLRTTIKESLDILDQLLIGLTKVPKGVFESIAAIGGLIILYKNVLQPLILWKNAQQALTVAMQINTVVATEETVAMTALAAGARNAAAMTAIATGGITLLTAAIVGSLLWMGASEKASRDKTQALKDEDSAAQQMISQYQRQIELVPKLANAHNSLQAMIDKGTLSADKEAKVKKQLDEVSQALTLTLGKEGAAQLDAANYTDEAVKVQVAALNELITKQNEARRNVLLDQKDELTKQLAEKKKEMDKAIADLKAEEAKPYTIVAGRYAVSKNLDENKQKVKDLTAEYHKLEESAAGVNVQLGEIAVDKVDQLAGSAGKAADGAQSLDEQMKDLQTQLKDAETAIADMNQASADMAAGHGINAQKVAELIAKYPELEGHIKKTKDGWIIEKSAIDSVKQAHVDLAVKMQASQATMSNAAFNGMDARIAMYGIELQAITDLKSAMAEANKIPDASGLLNKIADPEGDLSGAKQGAAQNEKLRSAIIEMGKTREDAKKLYEGLYSDNSYGVSKDKGSSSKKDDPLQKAFDEFKKRIDHLRAIGKLTTEQEIKEWKDAQSKFAGRTDLRWQVEEKLYDLQNKLRDDKAKKEKQTFQDSEGWINHKNALGQLSAQEELVAWERVQARYLKGTEERTKADQQVYAAKQRLLKDEETNLDELISKEKTYLQDSKQKALDKIQSERDAYVAAQDEKIRAIDRLLAAEQNANDDSDYEKKLAEKQARLALLQSAVGPEGIKERRDVAKEIETMQTEHQRVLRKRDLEAQKQAIEDEKSQKEKAWDEEKRNIESHYDDLVRAFDSFKNDVAGRAEMLKNVQILRESEKNATILQNLDAFVSQYQAKMSKISNIGLSQEDADLQEYNNNKDLFEAAKAKGNKSEMNRLTSRNEEIRDKYGIKTDTGKIQHFADGGIVQGRRGEPVPTVSHAGEMYLNERQQGNLFRLLDFKMPQLNFSMPQFAMAAGSNQMVINKHYYTVQTGDVNLHDDADVRTFWNERDNVVRRFQSRTGAKQR